MNTVDIIYSIKRAKEEDVISNLEECDGDFIPPLSSRVDLKEYGHKLYENSITFEAWVNEKLIGMVAAYLNNSPTGFISNVSVQNHFKGKNIASELMINCMRYAKAHHFSELILEVHEENTAAIGLYNKFNFKETEKYNQNIKMSVVL